jgi:acylphosphatase
MPVCRRVFYSGNVQGVGFRYTALHLARGFAVGGTVRNLADGRVELVAEGEAAEVDRFLAAVRRQMAGYIVGEDIQDQPPRGLTDFRIER